MVVFSPENVVVGNRKNVVGGLGINQKNVVVPKENVVVGLKNVDQNVVVGGIETHWAAVKAAHALLLEKPLSCVMVWLYNEARTHFISQI